MVKIRLILGILIIFFLGFIESNPSLFYQPQHFPTPQYDFSKNPLNADVIALGRNLFYEPLLSKDGSISCASCHSSFNAFAHTDHDLSHGINDSIGTRNAPALFNLAWQSSFMWDGAIHHLDQQALAPISHPAEMREDISHVVSKLQLVNPYPELFLSAFDDSIITGERLLKALSQFQLTLVSAQSKYDQVMLGNAQFSKQEKKGYRLFQQKCNSCHKEPLFSNYQFKSNGLPVDSTLMDFGRVAITKNPTDSFLFKVPSLRNLKYSFPYMHDGRFDDLYQVLNHYNAISPESKNVSQKLREGIRLNKNDQTDLVAFLLTLNDEAFVFNPKFQFPRKK